MRCRLFNEKSSIFKKYNLRVTYKTLEHIKSYNLLSDAFKDTLETNIYRDLYRYIFLVEQHIFVLFQTTFY